mgnify:CR=1 FL=1
MCLRRAQPSLCADCCAVLPQSTNSKGGAYTITVEVLVVKGVLKSYEWATATS